MRVGDDIPVLDVCRAIEDERLSLRYTLNVTRTPDGLLLSKPRRALVLAVSKS